MNATGFYQGQLVPVFPAQGVYPMPASTPGSLGRGTGPATLPSAAGALGSGEAAISGAAVNTGLPVWVFVLVLGAIAYLLLWHVFS